MDEFSSMNQAIRNINSRAREGDMQINFQNKNNVDQGELRFDSTFKYADEKSDEDSTNNINKMCDISPSYIDEFHKRDHDNQNSIEKKDLAVVDSSFDSDDSPENIQNIADILPILAELNESAVECINQENYEDALDSLLKAEYVVTVLVPAHSNNQLSKQADSPQNCEIESTYISTIYYNLACVCQKLSKLDECVKYLNKCIAALEDYCKKTTEIHKYDNHIKLIINKDSKSPKASQYSELLMKYRYLAKFNLQLCAVLSQLSEHTSAIEKGKLAVGFCQESIGVTEALCSKVIAYFRKKQDNKNTTPNEKEQDYDNPSLAYSVTAETKRQSNESNQLLSQLKRRNSEEPTERNHRFMSSPSSSLFESRAHSVSSNSSTMSIIMKEESKIEHLERLHSFSMKRSSSVSNDSRGIGTNSELGTRRSSNERNSK